MSELDKVMIYKRNLPDGCTNCGLSELACSASKSMNQSPCCGDSCTHG